MPENKKNRKVASRRRVAPLAASYAYPAVAPLSSDSKANAGRANFLASSPSTVVTALGPYPAQFNADLAEEKKCMDWVALTILTGEIQGADKHMDHGVTAIRIQVRALEYNPVQTTGDAAKRMYAMLQNMTKSFASPTL
jgi:hypothetical protein